MEHHWCSTISTKQDLVPRGHLFPPYLSTSCKLSNNTSSLSGRCITVADVHVIKSSWWKIVTLHLPLSIYNTRRVRNRACTYVFLQAVCPDTRCKHHSETICPCGYYSRQKTKKASETLIDFLQFQVNETLTEPKILVSPNRPNFFSRRKALIFNAIISNLPALVPIIMHLTQRSRITLTQMIAVLNNYQQHNTKASTFILKCNHVLRFFRPSTNAYTKLTATTKKLKIEFVSTCPLCPQNIAWVL